MGTKVTAFVKGDLFLFSEPVMHEKTNAQTKLMSRRLEIWGCSNIGRAMALPAL